MKQKGKFLALFLSLTMASSCFAFSATNVAAVDTSTVSTSATETVQAASKIQDGVILQAWCWSFNTIKDNMKEIANAGYTSVQTSPIQECVVGDYGGMALEDKGTAKNKGKWYYVYQPTNYTIGNYVLGTEQDFKDMCAEADKYGIKIIVDAVVNHVSNSWTAVNADLKKIEGGLLHSFGNIASYTDRKQVTQYKLGGLLDLKTQNKNVQNVILNYLKNCITDGADGFRYDAAKHIELPNDDAEYASDFWPTVLDNGAEFQYGEILQGDGTDRAAEYSKLMGVTASNYGSTIRSAIYRKDFTAAKFNSFGIAAEDNNIVTWVESHDNYCNDGTYSQLTEEDVTLAWATLVARSGGIPLFYDRPANASKTDQWGDNLMGTTGSNFYKSASVAEVNKFRTAMVGETEKLSNPNNAVSSLMIERGNKGITFVNSAATALTLENTTTALSDGTYTDKVSGGTFTVKDGIISGTLPARSVVVLYKSTDILLGDVNSDGIVNLKDSSLIQNYLNDKLELTADQKIAADFNEDGVINAKDSADIQRFCLE